MHSRKHLDLYPTSCLPCISQSTLNVSGQRCLKHQRQAPNPWLISTFTGCKRMTMANTKRKSKTDISANTKSNFLLRRLRPGKKFTSECSEFHITSYWDHTEQTCAISMWRNIEHYINNIWLNGCSPLVRVYFVCDHFNAHCPMTVALPNYLFVTK